MKRTISILKGFIPILMLFTTCFIVVSCNKKDIPVNNQSDDTQSIIETRGSDKDWTCHYCGNRNWEWKTVCIVCGTKHDEAIPRFTTTVWTYIKDGGGGGGYITELEGLTPAEVGRRIELPNGNFPSIEPEPWYENRGALVYYNELKNSYMYRFTPQYAEGADYAWYHITHILYPGRIDKTKVEQIYARWELNEARLLKGDSGQGMKDGSKAAVQAFINR